MAKSIIAMMEKNKVAIAAQPAQPIEKNKIPEIERKNRLSLLHVAMEYGMPGTPGTVAVGGIGSVVYSLCQAQKEHPDFIDARVVIPYYEALHKDLSHFEEIHEITHFYKDQFVKSMVLKKITAEGIIQYLIKPLESIGINLFNDVHIPEMIYSDGWSTSKFIERISYFASAVSEFSCAGEPSFKPDIVQGHGWAVSFLGKLIRQKRIQTQQEKPYTVYVAHSIHDGDGVFGFHEVPNIGIQRNRDHPVRLTHDIMDNGYDHIVYVSEQLLKESILNPNYETISNLVFEAYKSSKTSAILNNISTEKFDPSKCLPDEFKFNLNDICAGKENLKNYLNNGILKEKGKAINIYAPMVLYVGRYSDEKGIEKFDSAIQVMLKNQGTFFSMGIGDPSLIQSLIEKYKHEKSVIFFTTKEEQEAHGALIRSAADIFLVPSKIESCGLVPMEANTAGAIAVASRIGGLINVIIPDANGALFEFDRNLEEVLQNVLNSFVELKRTGNLNVVLKLIQESAVKSFDWNSIYAGSTFSYFNLYCRLGNEKEIQKKLIEQETFFTHALITKNDAAIDSILRTENPMFFLPNKIGLTPSELAARMNRPDIEDRINRIIYKRPHKELAPDIEPMVYRKKRIILNVCLEYKQIKLGGVGIFITSFVESINRDKNNHTECQIIMPHYPWHDELIQEKILKKKTQYEIRHLYNNQTIKSVVTKVINDGVTQYLIRPQVDELHQCLYQSITKHEANNIFHHIVPKSAYFNSAVAAFVSQSGLRFNILLTHGTGCALIARLLKEREKHNPVKTVQVVHSELSEQGVVIKNDENFHYLTRIGLNFDDYPYISPLREGVLHSDKTVYVSETLLNQAMNYFGYFNFNEIAREHHKNGKLVGILNGINDDFHPSKLLSIGDDWDINNRISTNKYIAKQKICALINQSLACSETPAKEKSLFHNKKLNPDKIWTVFIGRFSEEKGIDRLDDAIACTLQNHGAFIVMGLYGGGPEDLTIEALSTKYQHYPNVIILHEKNYNIQKKYGPLIRFAADITFIPSHRESAGLVSLEAQLNSNFVISSNVGGLNDSVIPYKTGLKYDSLHPKPYVSMLQTIAEANRFILDLKNNRPDDYEAFLDSLYQTSMQRYLFSSPDGPTKRYLDLFDSLCYFYPRKEGSTLNVKIKKPYGQTLIEDKLINSELTLSTRSGETISLYYEHENDKILRENYQKFSHNNHVENFLIGKIEYSEKNSEKIGKFVAVKKQNLHGLFQSEINTIMNEFNILHKMDYLELQRPHITENSDLFFFIKLYKGYPLAAAFNEYRGIELNQKLIYVDQLISDLKGMHQKNILHLDITEKNVVFEENIISNREFMQPRLIDFSASEIMPAGHSRVALNHFTENSPLEMLEGHASFATDIYGLGLFIFKYLFNHDTEYFRNRNPLSGIRQDLNYTMVLNTEIPNQLSDKESHVLREIKNMVLDMVAADESSRPSLDYCGDHIHYLQSILPLPSQLPEFSLEEYCRSAGFHSFDISSPRVLRSACEKNYIEIVKIILSNFDRKICLLASESNNLDLLAKVVQYASLDLIKLLLNHDFFSWVTVDGMIGFINDMPTTKSKRQDILGLFCAYLYAKEHGFSIADLTNLNSEGHTPLSKLMLTESWDGKTEFLIDHLVMHGANINQLTLYGLDVLYFLTNNPKIRNGSEVFVNLMKNGFILREHHLDYKGKLSENFYLKIQCLYFIQKNHISGNKPSSLSFNSKHTALTLAAEYANNDMIAYLLEFYKNQNFEYSNSFILNQKNKCGETPLHVAIAQNNFSTAYFLITNDADIHIKDLYGNTAIDLLRAHPDSINSKQLLSQINIHFQRKFYSVNIINLSEKLLYYFNQRNFSALYLSSLNNESKLTSAVKNRLLKSVMKNHPTKQDFIQLIDIGFCLNNIDKTGQSFLNWVTQENPLLSENLFLKELNFLNQEGFNLYDIDSINHTGHTPLSYAVSIQDIELIQTLVKSFHANVNAKNGVGNTALHLSVDTRNIEIVNLLLFLGADIRALNNEGLSPENLAWGNEFSEIIQCFDNFKKEKTTFIEYSQSEEDEVDERRIRKKRRIT